MQVAKMPTFSHTMRETLVKREQLTNEHIDLAQRLLMKQFHHLNHQCCHKEMVSCLYSTKPFKFTMSLANG